MKREASPFEWSGGHPALDFVNTLDERPFPAPVENLATYADLVRFVELANLIEPSVAAALRKLRGGAGPRIVADARRLREQTYRVLAAAHAKLSAPPEDLAGIAIAVRSAHSARMLVAPGSPSFARHAWSPPTSAAIPLHVCSLAVERLLLNVERRRIRKCGAADCEVYFLDTSKGQRRQWCSMTNCGNREKQRRWRRVQ
jgi:predicted RNA-binding Zn ribbon-like protein